MEYKPHNYQLYNVERIIADPAVGLFLRPGLGKTSITLTAISSLKLDRWAISKALVVAPKKVAEGTWQKEAAKWDHLRDLRIVTVLGTPARRIKALSTPGDVYVINRENVPWLVDYYGRQPWPFDMVVLDESTSFKNAGSQRFRAIRKIRRQVKKMVLLTGTPSSSGLEDLWAQIYLLDEGKRLGRTITSYREQYFVPDKRNATQIWSWKPKPGAEEKILAAISDICVTMKAEDYLELPQCIEHEVPVIMDEKTAKAYRDFEKDLLLEVDGDTVAANDAGVLTNKLLQFCAGAVYDEDRRVIQVHDAKLEAYMELLESIGGEPCITFYGFQHDRDRILAALAKTQLRVRTYENTADEDAWNAREIDVLLVHPASCAYGLNLQAGGRHLVWFTPSWSFELNDQGCCRIWRQGSPFDKVYIHYLIVQGGVDEDVLAAIRRRQKTHEAVMSVLKARIRAVGMEVKT